MRSNRQCEVDEPGIQATHFHAEDKTFSQGSTTGDMLSFFNMYTVLVIHDRTPI